MSARKRTALQLAKSQLAGGVPWGEVILGRCSLFVCQLCGVEFRVDAELEPCAFCNDCKDEALDRLAESVVALRAQLPRSKR